MSPLSLYGPDLTYYPLMTYPGVVDSATYVLVLLVLFCVACPIVFWRVWQ